VVLGGSWPVSLGPAGNSLEIVSPRLMAAAVLVMEGFRRVTVHALAVPPRPIRPAERDGATMQHPLVRRVMESPVFHTETVRRQNRYACC